MGTDSIVHTISGTLLVGPDQAGRESSTYTFVMSRGALSVCVCVQVMRSTRLPVSVTVMKMACSTTPLPPQRQLQLLLLPPNSVSSLPSIR